MKKLNLLYILFIGICLPACYDDLGNYDYHDINELEVEGISSKYAYDIDDSLNIVPTLQGTLYSDTSRFTYAWEIASSIVARTHDLHIVINMTPGEKKCRYIVTDKETKVKRYFSFLLNVSSSTAGDLLMVLSKYQGHAELSYLRLDKPSNWAINYYQERVGEILGIQPKQLLPCYMESRIAYPITTSQGRLMIFCDDQVQLFDKSTLQIDTIHPYLTGEAYTGISSYPPADIEGYKTQYIMETIGFWRTNPYGSGYQKETNFVEISGGAIYMAHVATNSSTPSYKPKVTSYYEDGSLCPFAYWDDMDNTPNDHLTQMGYSKGDLIVFDKANGRFTFYEKGSYMREVPKEDTKVFSGYEMIWGSATNRPNRGSIAILAKKDSQTLLLMLEHGKNSEYPNIGTKKLIGETSGGTVLTSSSKFYMMKYNDYLYFTNGNALYRYNILDINKKVIPNASHKVLDLTEYGYDATAMITSLCVSRSEKTLLLGVSRYGADTEGMGEEAKGDILYFDLNAANLQLTYREDKSARGISGIPVDVKIKYQTHWRDGIDADGVTFRDNI